MRTSFCYWMSAQVAIFSRSSGRQSSHVCDAFRISEGWNAWQKWTSFLQPKNSVKLLTIYRTLRLNDTGHIYFTRFHRFLRTICMTPKWEEIPSRKRRHQIGNYKKRYYLMVNRLKIRLDIILLKSIICHSEDERKLKTNDVPSTSNLHKQKRLVSSFDMTKTKLIRKLWLHEYIVS